MIELLETIFYPVAFWNEIIFSISAAIGSFVKWLFVFCLWVWTVIMIIFGFGSVYEWFVDIRSHAKRSGELRAEREAEMETRKNKK